MESIFYARIKRSSKYSYQDPGDFFQVWLTRSVGQAADGYLWEADLPGRNFRTKDLDLYIKTAGGEMREVHERKD